MESPVRICLGAALVVNLLLLSSTTVYGNAIPRDTTSTSIGDDGLSAKNRPKIPDVSLNELNSKIKPKVSTSEENAKYKDRGRGNVKFHSQHKSTESVRRRMKPSESPQLLEVTSTQIVKTSVDLDDSEQLLNKTKILSLASTTTPMTVEENEQSDEEDDDDDGEEEDSSEKFTSNFDNFFSIPSFGDFSHDSDFESSNKNVKHDFDSPTYGGFSSLFPHQSSYGFTEPTHNTFKAEFFNYDVDLTTPKNDFFDKKFRQVSGSIKKNLDTIKAKAAPTNVTNVQKIIKENLGLEKIGNNSLPGNKSSVYIKNTKEIRLLDNDGAGSANKELSDVHGTSIYYEMSVLSTETYAINDSDYDCENDTLPSGPTPSTSIEEEEASLNVTHKSIPVPTRPTLPDASSESLSIVSSSYSPATTLQPIYNTVIPITSSTPKPVLSTDKIKTYLNHFRNRNYSKRLNFNGNKDSLNSVTSSPVINSSSLSPRLTPKFQLPKFKTTPKNKRVWMWPRRNVTSGSSTVPTLIYSEHFSIKGNTTTRPRLSSPFFIRPSKAVLTTVSSDIDPVLQDDIAGPKKVVHSQQISDNMVPSLSKRGSTKFVTTTISSKEVGAESEIPPTAWALATLRVPPPSPNTSVNRTQLKNKNIDNKTGSINKTMDENEVQSVSESPDKIRTTPTTSTTSTILNPMSNDIIPKRVADALQINSSWQPITVPTLSTTTTSQTLNKTKSEELDSESNISAQNILDAPTSTEVIAESEKEIQMPWIPVTQEHKSNDRNEIEKEIIPVVNTTKSTSFESISKLPAEVTTPQDISVASSEVNQTTTNEKPTTKMFPDYEITTIRFSYVPTEEVVTSTGSEQEPTDPIVPSTWHPVFPTRTGITTIEDTPVTTYRPKYTATETEDETTTIFIESTSPIEVSSQVLINTTKMLLETTEIPTETTETPSETTEIPTETPTTTEVITEPVIKESTTDQGTTEETATEFVNSENTTMTVTQTTISEPTYSKGNSTSITTETVEDTTTIVVEVVTEINIEKVQTVTSTYSSSKTTKTSNKDKQETAHPDGNSSSNEVTQETMKTTNSEIPTGSVSAVPVTVKTTNSEIPTGSVSAVPVTVKTTNSEISTGSVSAVPVTVKRTNSEIPTGSVSAVPVTVKTTNSEIPTGSVSAVPVTVKITTKTHKAATATTEIPTTMEAIEETTSQLNGKIRDTTVAGNVADTEYTTKVINEDTTIFSGDMTTEASSRVFETEEAGSGAAIAIAVSTIGVIALILLIGLLLVVRRRGRRGVYAQRCTPVSLDAYSLDSVSVGHRKGNQRLRASKRSYGNPAYDDEVTSHPMQYAALANFALDVESMSAEFAEIPSVSVRPDEVPPGCEDKNRYSNVLPLPETRVPLQRLGGDPTTEYINANFITGPGNIRNYYIACQAPLSNTVGDFWRMIWEQNSRLVVMLTEYMENGVEKCFEYLPPSEISDNKRIFGDFKIILKKREQRDKYAVSSVQLINLSTRTWREVTHLWYFWPAKGVPDDYDSVIDFLCEMRSYMKVSQAAKEYDEEGVEVIYGDQSRTSFSDLSKLRSDESGSGNGLNVYSPSRAEEQMRRVPANNGTLGRMKAASDVEGIRPCVVVCASGAGRSAALVALDICARALPGAADVPRVVRHLRAQRPHSLSNRHHYIFVYKVLSEYGNKMLGGGVDTI